MSAVCRVCLTSNVTMHTLVNTPLLETYERLTSFKLNTDDGMPNTICHICLWLLQKCYRFSETARRSQEILSNLLWSGEEVLLQFEYDTSMINLCVTPTQFTDSNNESFPAIVQVESIKGLDFIDEAFEIGGINLTDDDLNILEPVKIKAKRKARKINKRIYCDVCNECFTNKKNLASHLRIHKEKPFACTTCDSRFAVKKHLTVHMETHKVKPFICNRCDKCFAQKFKLNRHMLTHAGEPLVEETEIDDNLKPFSCDHCDMKFTNIEYLTTHMVVHTDAMPFACDKCDKMFTQIKDLSKHVETHNETKLFDCHVCDKKFTQRWSLTVHLRTHSGEKPFSCDKCKKTFALKGNLLQHLRTHTGERPFSCNRCKKTFVNKGNVLHHKRLHCNGKKP